MRYAVLGGDARFVHLTAMLNESGRQASGFLQGEGSQPWKELKKYSCIISNWPMRWPLTEEELDPQQVLENIVPGSVLLLCGPQFPAKRRWDLQYINLWQDEILLQENAWLTAQGAVASAMKRLGTDLKGQSCMVLGYGRIGRALTEILTGMGARLTVASSKQSKLQAIRESGAHPVLLQEMRAVLPEQRLIFSTPPAMVLDGESLRDVDRRALIIDLASPPYGVDLEAAAGLGLNAVQEPGLPGRCYPFSAARALFNAVIRWEEGNRDEI